MTAFHSYWIDTQYRTPDLVDRLRLERNAAIERLALASRKYPNGDDYLAYYERERIKFLDFVLNRVSDEEPKYSGVMITA